MAFTLQDDTGTVAGANAYISEAEFDLYHNDRGNDFSAYNTAQKQQAIIKATDYIDRRFRYIGRKRAGRNQVTEWPRSNAYDRGGYFITDIPVEVKDAAAEYAFRYLTTDLLPDPTTDETGRVIQRKTEIVGPLEETIEYQEGAPYELPRYPSADMILRRSGLVIRGGDVRRA